MVTRFRISIKAAAARIVVWKTSIGMGSASSSVERDGLYPPLKSLAEVCAERKQCSKKSRIQEIKSKKCCNQIIGRDRPQRSNDVSRNRRFSDQSLQYEDCALKKEPNRIVRFCVSSPHIFVDDATGLETTWTKTSGGILRTCQGTVSKQLDLVQCGIATGPSIPTATLPRQRKALVLPPIERGREKPLHLQKELSTLQVGYVVFSIRTQQS